MVSDADVLNTEVGFGQTKPRQRTRRRCLTVRIPVIGPDGKVPPRTGRVNPHGFKFANEARKRQAREKTEAMADRWHRAGQVFPGNRGVVMATLFGVSRAAAYQRMYRYRRGFYERERQPRPVENPPVLRLDLNVVKTPPARSDE